MADKTYLIEKSNGDMLISIPEEYKLTFGPAFIAKKETMRTYNQGGIPWALRVYEGTAQRAVFMDVTSFRDTSIQVRTKKVTAIAGKGIKMDWEENIPDDGGFVNEADFGVDWAGIINGAVPEDGIAEPAPARRRRR